MSTDNGQVLMEKAAAIAAALPDAQRVLMVGGCVRDKLLGLPVKDIDLEVYGLSYEQIVQRLRRKGFRLGLVGKQFAVIKVGPDIDVSIPRRENKTGTGHKGFAIEADPSMTFADAAARRDFTINAIGEDFEGRLTDPFNGTADLKKKILRATGPAFAEDPLRVLRGMQLAARFDLQMDAQTIEQCRHMADEFPTIARERLWVEWEKWATKSSVPARGLEVLRATGWIRFFPEIDSLIDVPQDPQWHPEGDCFVHTLHVCNAAARIAERDGNPPDLRALLLFSALCHDFGKALTTQQNDQGRWIAPEHAPRGVPLAESFLQRIHSPLALIERVRPLVAEHMVHIFTMDETPSDRAVRRLANRLHPASIRMLSQVIEADHSGRPPLPAGNPFTAWLEVAAKVAAAEKRPTPILMGRHLLARGHKPGPEMGEILKSAFEAQLDGTFETLEGALKWLEEQ